MTNYFKTLLYGIKASIEKNSKNDWNANKDEIGYIENKPFYEETKTVNVDVLDENIYVPAMPFYFSADNEDIIENAFLALTDEPLIVVTVDNNTYTLPQTLDYDNKAVFGATIVNGMFTNTDVAPISFLIDGKSGDYFICCSKVPKKFSLELNGNVIVEDIDIYPFSTYDTEGSVIRFTDILASDDLEALEHSVLGDLVNLESQGALPENITITINDIDYELPLTEQTVSDYTYHIYGDYYLINYPICFPIDSTLWGYISAELVNYTTLRISYNGDEWFNSYFAMNFTPLIFSSTESEYIITDGVKELISDQPESVVIYIGNEAHILPKTNSPSDGLICYGAPLTMQSGSVFIDFRQHPMSIMLNEGDPTASIYVSHAEFLIKKIVIKYSIAKAIVHQIDKKFIPVVDIQVDDYIDWDNMTSENPVQNKVIADAMNGLQGDLNSLQGDLNSKMIIGQSYVTAGQKSGTTLGAKATAEGFMTEASGAYSHAEGYRTIASGGNSHAEGSMTTASGSYSHAEGEGTIASGQNSHVEGYGTTAQRRSQHVFGEYNILDTSGSITSKGAYIEIVGNGTANTSRSNARTLDWSGNETLAGKLTTGGKITVGSAPTADMDVATKKYVDEHQPSFNVDTITIYNSDWNSDHTATKLVEGITLNSTIILSPGPAYVGLYNSCGIYCSSQNNGSLTFTCTSFPSDNIDVNIIILL